MQIQVKVIPNASKNHMKKERGLYKVYLTTQALQGRANKALIEFIAENFGVKRRQVEITKGLKLRTKTINIYKNI